MSEFHTDTPITGEIGSDQLNRSEFAKRVGKALLLPSGSAALVVALEGKWGYGKTSTINLITQSFKDLDENDQPIILNFNPWMVGSSEKLVQEFLVQLASKIGITGNKHYGKNAIEQLHTYSQFFPILKFIPISEVQISVGIIQRIIKCLKAISNVIYAKSLKIDEQRKKVEAALTELKRPIIVLIDDIDRLPPDEVFQVIRLVKAIVDFPRIAFVLAFDPSYIEAALSVHGISDAQIYLDKLVQVRLSLPYINVSDIDRLVSTELEKMSDMDLTARFDGDKDRFGQLYIRCIASHSFVLFVT